MKGLAYLLAAVIFEVGWPLSFKLSVVYPQHHLKCLVAGLVAYAVSGILLYLAQRTMPVSTAYIIWTGAGAVCTFLIGVFCFGDAMTWIRAVSVLMIVAGIVGLEIC